MLSYHFNTYSEVETFGKTLVAFAAFKPLAVFNVGHNVSLSVLGEVALLREGSAAELSLERSEVFMHTDMVKDVPALREQSITAAISAPVDVLCLLARICLYPDTVALIRLQQQVIHFVL